MTLNAYRLSDPDRTQPEVRGRRTKGPLGHDRGVTGLEVRTVTEPLQLQRSSKIGDPHVSTLPLRFSPCRVGSGTVEPAPGVHGGGRYSCLLQAPFLPRPEWVGGGVPWVYRGRVCGGAEGVSSTSPTGSLRGQSHFTYRNRRSSAGERRRRERHPSGCSVLPVPLFVLHSGSPRGPGDLTPLRGTGGTGDPTGSVSLSTLRCAGGPGGRRRGLKDTVEVYSEGRLRSGGGQRQR